MQPSEREGLENVRALAEGAAINFSGVVSRMGLVLVYSFAAARLFGPDAYGLYAIGLALTDLLGWVGQVGMDRTIVRYVALYGGMDDRARVRGTILGALRFSLPISLLLGMGLFLVAEPVAVGIYHTAELTPMLRMFGLAVPLLTLARLLLSFTRGFKVMRYQVLAHDIARPLLELLLIGFVFWMGWWASGLALAYLLSVLATAILALRYAKRLFPLFDRSIEPVIEARNLISFALPVLVVNLLITASARANVLMLGAMAAKKLVGVYGIIERVVNANTVFILSMNTVFGPMIADMIGRDDWPELERLFKVSTRWVFTVGLPFPLALAYLAKPALSLFGETFLLGAGAMVILGLVRLADLAVGSSGLMIVMSGRPLLNAFNEFVRLVVNVVLNIALIPGYGLVGAAIAAGCGLVVANLLRLLEVRLLLQVHPYQRAFLKPVLAGIGMLTVLLLWSQVTLVFSGLPGALIGLFVGLGVYGLGLVVLGLEEEDKRAIVSLRRWAGSVQP